MTKDQKQKPPATPVAELTQERRPQRKVGTPYQVRGNSLIRGHDRCIATARGVDIFDDENRRVGTMRENELFDSDYRKIMSIRGDDIHNASDVKVGTVSSAREMLSGEGDVLLIVSFWYCFVR